MLESIEDALWNLRRCWSTLGVMDTDLKRLAEVLDPEFISGSDSWSVEILRRHRKDAEDLEVAISYARRIVQGRIDVYEKYVSGAHGECIESSLDKVTHALAENTGSGKSRIAYTDISSEALIPTAREISDLIGVDIESIVESPPAITELLGRLKAGERRLSEYRRSLHSVIDALRQQLVLRYQSGQTTVDQILENDAPV